MVVTLQPGSSSRGRTATTSGVFVDPTFKDIYAAIKDGRLARVVSQKGTTYTLEATQSTLQGVATQTIIARPGGGQVRIHEDCWLKSETCQRTRAGGVNFGIREWWQHNRR